MTPGEAAAISRSWEPAVGNHIVVISNPAAGRYDHAWLHLFLGALHRCGFSTEHHATAAPADAEKMARQFGGENCDLIVVAGGDGTVNEVINGLATMESPPPISVIPMGTANVLAAELALPATPRKYADALAVLTSRQAWIANINGRSFTLMASVGFDAHVVDAVNKRLKRLVGKAAYGWAALMTLLRYQPRNYILTIDGQTIATEGAIICNGCYYGGRFVVAEGARLTEPYLYVCFFPRCRRMDILRYAAHLLCGSSLDRARGVQHRRATEVRIDGVSDLPVQGDGDILCHLPALIRLQTRQFQFVFGTPT